MIQPKTESASYRFGDFFITLKRRLFSSIVFPTILLGYLDHRRDAVASIKTNDCDRVRHGFETWPLAYFGGTPSKVLSGLIEWKDAS